MGQSVEGESYTTFRVDGSESFHVSGYRYAEGETCASVPQANFLSDATVSYQGAWKANQQYVMPAATDRIDFFAWFVANEPTSGVTAVDAQGGLQLSYDMPTDVAWHPDLLTAARRSESYSSDPGYYVPLSFHH